MALRGARRFFFRKLCISSFANTDANATLFVTEDECSGKIESATACHHARDAADTYHFLRELAAASRVVATLSSITRPARATAARSSTSITHVASRRTWLFSLTRYWAMTEALGRCNDRFCAFCYFRFVCHRSGE